MQSKIEQAKNELIHARNEMARKSAETELSNYNNLNAAKPRIITEINAAQQQINTINDDINHYIQGKKNEYDIKAQENKQQLFEIDSTLNEDIKQYLNEQKPRLFAQEEIIKNNNDLLQNIENAKDALRKKLSDHIKDIQINDVDRIITTPPAQQIEVLNTLTSEQWREIINDKVCFALAAKRVFNPDQKHTPYMPYMINEDASREFIKNTSEILNEGFQTSDIVNHLDKFPKSSMKELWGQLEDWAKDDIIRNSSKIAKIAPDFIPDIINRLNEKDGTINAPIPQNLVNHLDEFPKSSMKKLWGDLKLEVKDKIIGMLPEKHLEGFKNKLEMGQFVKNEFDKTRSKHIGLPTINF